MVGITLSTLLTGDPYVLKFDLVSSLIFKVRNLATRDFSLNPRLLYAEEIRKQRFHLKTHEIFSRDITQENHIMIVTSSFSKMARNSFQHLIGHYNHSLSLDATIMVSKNCPTIGEHVVTILVTQ